MSKPKRTVSKSLISKLHDEIVFRGDAFEPPPGGHYLNDLVVQVVARLPVKVRRWLLEKTEHIFIGGSVGGLGACYQMHFGLFREKRDGLTIVRIILLSGELTTTKRSEAEFTVAHEIAHSWLNHGNGSDENERAADQQAGEWGFTVPAERYWKDSPAPVQ